MMCSHGQGGEGISFSRVCADVFYGRSLNIFLYFEIYVTDDVFETELELTFLAMI